MPHFRTKRLALGLSIALCTSGALESALAIPLVAGTPQMQTGLRQMGETRRPQQNPPQTWIVQNCEDDGPGSLRAVVTNVAQSGDTVDLSQIDCSTIALNAEIAVAQKDLTLVGLVADQRTVTISGADAVRIFKHEGLGNLQLEGLTLSHGYVHTVNTGEIAQGGCIDSAGNVVLINTLVESCLAQSDNGDAFGGGIFAVGQVTLVSSTVSGNVATTGSTYCRAMGGGIKVNTQLAAKYSSITGNVASSPVFAVGGGAFTYGSALLLGSTIDSNQAEKGGGLTVIGSLSIRNSSISENFADAYPALRIGGDSTIANTTIAFNHATSDASPGAAYFIGSGLTITLSLQSSIIANNTAGAGNTPSDLYINNTQLAGADNLVMTANQSPPGVIKLTSDPMLGPLQLNGGWTRTHALLPGSPAISAGNNSAMESYDQRGAGYPRTTGPSATTDIGAYQFDTIFADNFD